MITYKPLQYTLIEKGMTIKELEEALGYFTLREKLNSHAYLSLETIDKICHILGVNDISKVIGYNPSQQVFEPVKKPVFVKPDWDKIKKINRVRGFKLMSIDMGHKSNYISALKRREWIGINVLENIKKSLDEFKGCEHDLSSLYLEKREGRAPRKRMEDKE